MPRRDYDDADDLPQENRRRRPNDGGLGVIVPYRNGMALAAYYCGIFGLIPILGFVLGPLALIFGVLGLIAARKNPDAHGTGHAVAGIILGIIDPVLWLVLGYLMWGLGR